MPQTFTNYLVVFVAIIHIWYFLMAMFRWKNGFGADLVGPDEDAQAKAAPFARLQAVHSGLIGIGLCWCIYLMNAQEMDTLQVDIGFYLRRYLLWSAIILGIAGARLVSKYFFFAETVPALVALIFAYLRK